MPCEKCVNGSHINCIKNKCIHGSLVKSIIGVIEAKLYSFLKTYKKEEGITLGEMQRSAMNVLRFAMNSPAMDRLGK